MKQLTTSSRVKVSVYKNEFFANSYTGSVIGFTKSGLVKVKPDTPMAGIKCVSADNVKVIAATAPPSNKRSQPDPGWLLHNQNIVFVGASLLPHYTNALIGCFGSD